MKNKPSETFSASFTFYFETWFKQLDFMVNIGNAYNRKQFNCGSTELIKFISGI